MKDLIIGSASNYSWDVVKYWVNSIKQTGFDGDIVLVGSNIDNDTIKILEEKNVKVHNYNNNFSSAHPNVERFFFLWHCLATMKQKYRFVLTTDTRDVIFQKNPSLWLEKNLTLHDLVASSEGLKYKDEPWGNDNYFKTFGEFFYYLAKDKLIFNAGVIGGKHDTIASLLFLIFHMSTNRSVANPDQAIYNLLINNLPFENNTFFSTNSDGWAIQMGTTKEAVQAGFGDIGMICKNDPSKFVLYQMNYKDEQPVIENDVIYTKDKTPFTIVHQYDRIPYLKKLIHEKYES